jgi:hypothetical protein
MGMPIGGVSKTGAVTGVKDDKTPPPTPQVQVSIAFERGARDATFQLNSPPPTRTFTSPRIDPAYIQFGNVEAGTRIQMLNLSAKPDASWDNPEDVVELPLTGGDVQNRQAAAYLPHEAMEKLNISAGHMLQFRAIDEQNNVSQVATAEVAPNNWANGRVREKQGDAFVETQGAQISVLDGGPDGKFVPILAKTVVDTSAPIAVKDRFAIKVDDRFTPQEAQLGQTLYGSWNTFVAYSGGKQNLTRDDFAKLATDTRLPDNTKAALRDLCDKPGLFDRVDTAYQPGTAKDGLVGMYDLSALANFRRSVTLSADAGVEPRAQVSVQNQRTGATQTGTVGDNRQVAVRIDDVQDGDPLVITVTDHDGVRGKPFMVSFDDEASNGIAPPPRMPVLPGVIEQDDDVGKSKV